MNPDLARFCDGCGAELEIRCPGCGRVAGFPIRMCPSCGQDLPYAVPRDEASLVEWAARTPLGFLHPIDGKLFRRVQESYACMRLAREPRRELVHPRRGEELSEFARLFPELTLRASVWGSYAVGGRAEVVLEPDARACGLLRAEADWLVVVPRVFADVMRREEVSAALHRELFHLLVGNVHLFPLVAAARGCLGARDRRDAGGAASDRSSEGAAAVEEKRGAELVLRWFEFASYSADRFAIAAAGGVEVFCRSMLKEAMIRDGDEELVRLHGSCRGLEGEELIRRVLEGLGTRPELFRRLWEANAFARSSLGRRIMADAAAERLWEAARSRLASPLSVEDGDDGNPAQVIPFPARDEGRVRAMGTAGSAEDPSAADPIADPIAGPSGGAGADGEFPGDGRAGRAASGVPASAAKSSPRLGLRGEFTALFHLSAYENAIVRYGPEFAEEKRISLEGRLRFPRHLAAGPDGELWILDGEENEIWRLEVEGERFRKVDLPVGSLSRPRSIAVDGRGRVWVADEGRGLVVVADDRVAAVHAGEETGEREWGRPSTVVHDGRRNAIWLVDGRRGRVVKLDPEGHFLFAFSLPGEDGRPAAMAVDGEGNLFLGAERGGRIVVVDGGGRPEEFIEPRRDPLGEIAEIEVDGAGRLYVLRRRRPGIRILGRDGVDGDELVVAGDGKDHFGFGSSICLLVPAGRV